jgi:hypothetical protein
MNKNLHQLNREINAWDRGRAAYRHGADCIPANDEGLRKLLEGKQVGESIRLFDEWQRGWVFECLNYGN